MFERYNSNYIFPDHHLLNNALTILQKGWYHNLVYLGKERDIPILTITYGSNLVFCSVHLTPVITLQ